MEDLSLLVVGGFFFVDDAGRYLFRCCFYVGWGLGEKEKGEKWLVAISNSIPAKSVLHVSKQHVFLIAWSDLFHRRDSKCVIRHH